MSVLAITKHGRAVSDISKAAQVPPKVIEEQRSLLSRFLFLWVGPLLEKGSERSLVLDDLPSLKQKHRSVNLLRKWKIGANANILSLLFWQFKLPFFTAVVTRLLSIVLDYANPVLLKLLIDSSTSDTPLTTSLTISILMFTVAELKSVVLAIHTYVTNRDAALAMSIVTNCIAKKSLRLCPSSALCWPSSRLSNLVAVDVEALAAAAPFLHYAWSAVLEVLVALFFIYRTIGTASIGAVAVMLLYVPLNVLSSRTLRSLQATQMIVKDKRVNFTKEVLCGMTVVKLYGWEVAFEEEIGRLRTDELRLLTRSTLLSRVLQALNSAAPFMVAVVCFTWFALANPPGSLTPQVAFVCLIVFNMLRRPMTVIAPSIQYITKALVSVKRVNELLNSSELRSEKKVESLELEEVQVLIGNASFSWDGQAEHLRRVCLEIDQGQFHAVVGPSGSGKSTLLAAILGEMTLLTGIRNVKGKIGYVAQNAWIMNLSIRANILYGQDYDKNKYDKITRACDLKKDFYNMPRYDSTIVGENGAALSGGQKARIALARALYQDCDIYLLDDPFAAVDNKVANIIYDQLLGPTGLISKKTVILVTHSMEFTKKADVIHFMRDCAIIESGTYEELCESNEQFFELTRLEPKMDAATDTVKKPKRKVKTVMFEPIQLAELKKMEPVETGKINFSVYATYLRSFSYHWAAIFLFLLGARYSVQALSGMWLSEWSNHNQKNLPDEFSRSFFLQIYIALGLCTVLLNVVAFVSSTFGGVRASLHLHRPLVHSLLRAPIAFFQSTPVGSIINRIAGDMDVIDTALPINIRLVIDTLMNMVMVMAVISITVPAFIVMILPFVAGYIIILNRFLPSSRQIRRLESAQRSSLLSTLVQNVQGATTIRAFGRVKMTQLQFHDETDSFLRCRYLLPATQRWLALRMELLGNFMVLACALLVSVFHHFHWISAGDVGLCVSYALTLTEVLNFSVRMMGFAENNVVSVERIKEYHEIPSESDWSSDYPLIDAWPHSGCIEMMKYNLHYGKESHALNDISFTIKGGEKIGIVGRTGSGKSSLVTALLRLVEGSGGDIKIDGVNIAEIGLHQLRSRITVIPQEPVLFSSSLRFNLDPLGELADSDLWLALEACQLKETVSQSGKGLAWIMEGGGRNISVGERQLVCVCRALLKGGQVVILDEATASIDGATETLVNQVVGEHFKQATMLIITHRLHPIRNCDRILVLSDGHVAEFDSPDALLDNSDSMFSEMIEQKSK